jgi:hypothetical protein
MFKCKKRPVIHFPRSCDVKIYLDVCANIDYGESTESYQN